MGHQGASWCALGPDGVMILMSHQNFFYLREGQWMYEVPPEEQMPQRAPSAARSLQVLGDYFEPGKAIILPVAVFDTDGGLRPDGTFEASVFRYATGDVYRATMQAFNPANGHILCSITERFTV